jgi:RNA polymerase sigma-70 factor (sigma-E family)
MAPTADRDVDPALAALYREHYGPLVRLAALLVRNAAAAEEVVQDSFVATHRRWRRLGDSDRALSYLRESVVNRSRAARQARADTDHGARQPPPDITGTDRDPITPLEQSAVVGAMGALPPRQREALVLRYYGNLTDPQIAAAMGISLGAVKTHTAMAMNALGDVLESAC